MKTHGLKTVVAIFLAVSLAGCLPSGGGGGGNNGNNGGEGDAGSDTTQDTGGGEDSTSVDTGTAPGGPEFLDVSVTPPGMTEGEFSTILAQVSDPDGFEDIGGGRVMDASGNVLATFSGSQGTYEASVSWSAINGARPRTFASEQTVTLVLEFFDASNNRSTTTAQVRLYCPDGPACDGQCTFGGDVCGGECVDTTTSKDHCGGCGQSCSSNQLCQESTCVEATRPMTPCEFDSDCSGEGFCSDLGSGPICMYECSTDDDCPGAAICPSDSLPICVELCSSDSDCVEGTTCQDMEEILGADPGTFGCLPPL
ncbi:MAG: hypothetical protein ACQEVA_02865 [Myxococcota bacterium]